MNEIFEATGGARVGWTNATWPLAKLTATPHSLRVNVLLLGNYSFTPDTVVAITRYTMIPVFGWGIQIQHCAAEYPARFIFWCLGSPNALLAGIHEAGFIPRAPLSAMPPRLGLAIRWQAIVIAVVVWNGLFVIDLHSLNIGDLVSRPGPPPFPGPFSLLALGLVVIAAIATIRVPGFQRLVLKPDRSVGEIRPFLNLLLFIASFMFAIFSLIALFR